MNTQAQPPIIVIGMHRSGTTLVARVLEQMGIFMGNQVDHNHEAVFFLQLNKWMFDQAHAYWDNPHPFLALLEHQDLCAKISSQMTRFLKSPGAASYLGWPTYLRHRDVAALPAAWGWKDPRNTFTLPLWRTIFPDAKVIHVFRHGVDTAVSLFHRSTKSQHRTTDKLNWKGKLLLYGTRHRGVFAFCNSIACLEPTYGFSLWEQYITQAERVLAQIPEQQKISVCFESLMQSPDSELSRLSTFVGQTISASQRQTIASQFDPGRTFAYRHSDVGRALFQTVQSSPVLKRMGYSA